MTVFKSYLKVLRKNSIGIFAYIIIFTIMTLVNANQTSKNDVFDSEKYIKLAVINQDNDRSMKGLKEYLGEKFKEVYLIDDEKNITEALVTGYADYVVKIKDNKNIVYYEYKNKGESFIVNQKIWEYLKIYGLLEKYSIKSYNVADRTEKIVNDNPSVKLTSKNGQKNPVEKGLYYYFCFLLFPIMSILILGVYYGTSSFRKIKVKNRLDVSFESSKKINKKLVASSISFVFATWIYFLILAIIVYEFNNVFSKEGIGYLISSLVYLVPCFSIAFFVSAVFKSSEVVNGITSALPLFFAFTSGVFVPIEFLPDYVEKISIISPMYWSMQVFKAISDGNFYSVDTLVCLGIEILMGLSIFLVTFIFLKNRSMKTLN